MAKGLPRLRCGRLRGQLAWNDARWAVFTLARATQVHPQTNPLNPLMRYITAMTSLPFVYCTTIHNKVTAYCVCIFAGNPVCWKSAGPHQSRWFQSAKCIHAWLYWDTAKYTLTLLYFVYLFFHRKCLSVCELQRDHCSLMLTTQKVEIPFCHCLCVVHVMGIIFCLLC